MTLYKVIQNPDGVRYWTSASSIVPWIFPKLHVGTKNVSNSLGKTCVPFVEPGCPLGLFVDTGVIENSNGRCFPVIGLLIGEEVRFFVSEDLEEVTEEDQL